MVAIDLQITEARLDKIDFSIPVSDSGVVLVARKPTFNENDLFSFLNPISNKIWIASLTSFIIVVILTMVFISVSEKSQTFSLFVKALFTLVGDTEESR